MLENSTESGNRNRRNDSPLGILHSTIAEVARLEAEYESNFPSNQVASKKALVDQAKAVAALPRGFEDLREQGIFVSETIANFADEIAAQAERMIATDSFFGLSVLLIPKGSRVGDPNLLEEFTSRLDDDAIGKRFNELVDVDTSRDRCVEIIKGLLTSDEVINLGHTRDEAADRVVESLSYLGVFAPTPATFEKIAFEMTGGAELDPEAVDTMWNFFLRTNILNDEERIAKSRVSISPKLTQMLLDPANGYLTD